VAPHASALALQRARRWGSALGLLALTLLAWGGVPGGAFQFDDRASALVHAAPGVRIRPLLALTWAADQALHGERAAGWLAENLVLHCLTVLVVLALGRRLLSPLGAFLGAAAFAMQPAHAEVVAYVSGRSTGLMALFLLGGLWMWRPSGSPWRLAGAGALFAAAVATKEVALIFPALLFLWALALPPQGVRRFVSHGVEGPLWETPPRPAPPPPRVIGRFVPRAAAGPRLEVPEVPEVLGRLRLPGVSDVSWRLPRRRVVAFVGLAVVLGVAVAAVRRYRELAAWSLAERGPVQSLALSVAVLPEQLSLWLRPWALSVEHTVDPGRPLLPGLVVLGALLGAALACRRRLPGGTLSVAWVLTALLPTHSVIARADVLNEKSLYLAWVGPALFLGGGLAWVWSRLALRPVRRWAAAVVLGALAAFATVEIRERVTVWRSPQSLWADAVRKAPQSSRAWNNLASALRTDSLEDALRAARRSVELDPSNPVALANLANLEVLCPRGCIPE
jgi:protein O-mannosyl-transferase